VDMKFWFYYGWKAVSGCD